MIGKLICTIRGKIGMRPHTWTRGKAIGAGAKQCIRCGITLTIKARKPRVAA